MKKIIGMFLAVCVFFGSGYLLMPQIKDPEIVKTPTIKEVGGFWYVYMDFTCLKSRMGEKWNAFNEECRKQELKPSWMFLIFYNWSENANDEIKWTMAYVVSEDTNVTLPLKMTKIEKFKAMVYTHTGSMEVSEISKSNKFLSKYIKDKGLKELWPNYELIHLKSPRLMHLWYLVEGIK